MQLKKVALQQQIMTLSLPLILIGCGGGSSSDIQPNDKTFTPEKISFEKNDFSAENYEGEVVENDESLRVVPNPPIAQAEVAGDYPFANYQFQFTGETVKVPHPDKCPQDTDFLMDEDSTRYAIKFAVGQETNVASVLQNDSLAIEMVAPENRYGVTYRATLNYAGEDHDFSLTIPEATDTLPDAILFDRKALNDDQGNLRASVPNTETLIFPIALPEGADKAKVKPGITGMNKFVKAPFDFNFDGGTFTNDAGEKLPIARVVVVDAEKGIKDDEFDGLRTYNQCGTTDDTLAVVFQFPKDSFNETYTASLKWKYETVNEEGVATVQEEIHEFSVATDPIDQEPNALTFINEEGKTVSEDVVYEISPQGFNVPIEIESDSAYLSINGEEFSQGKFTLRPGDVLKIKVIASDKFLDIVNADVTIAGKKYEWSIETAANPDWAKFVNHIEFPPKASATANTSVIVRGTATIEGDSDVTVTAENILVNGEPVDTYNPATKAWTKELTNLEAESNVITVKGKFPAGTELASPAVNAFIYKLENNDTLFPTNDASFDALTDVTIDTRHGEPVLYLSAIEKTYWRYPLATTLDALQKPLSILGYSDNAKTKPKTGADNNYNKDNIGTNSGPLGTRGIQVINGEAPEKTSIFSTLGFQLRFFEVDPSSENNKQTESNNGNANPWNPWHLATDKAGKYIYAVGSGGRSNLKRGGLNVGLIRFKLTDREETGSRFEDKNAPELVTHRAGMGDTHSVEILSMEVNNQLEEYIFVLSRAGGFRNDGANRLWVIKQADSYPDTFNTTTEIILSDENGDAINLSSATAIAIDDEQRKLFISDQGKRLVMVDLSNFDFDALNPEESLTANAPARVVIDDISTPFNRLSSLVMEGNIKYMVGTDFNTNHVYAIDPITYEVVTLLKAKKTGGTRELPAVN